MIIFPPENGMVIKYESVFPDPVAAMLMILWPSSWAVPSLHWKKTWLFAEDLFCLCAKLIKGGNAWLRRCHMYCVAARCDFFCRVLAPWPAFPRIVCQPAVLVLPSLSSDLLPFLDHSHSAPLKIGLIGMNKHCWMVRSLVQSQFYFHVSQNILYKFEVHIKVIWCGN